MTRQNNRPAAKRMERIRTRFAPPAEPPTVSDRDPAEVISISAARKANKWEAFKKLQADIIECREIVSRLERIRDGRLAEFIAEAAESKLTDEQIAHLEQNIAHVRGFWV